MSNELPDRFHFDGVLYLRVQALGDEDLAGGGLIGEARRARFVTAPIAA